MFVVLLIPVLLGMAGLAIDFGGMAGERRELQNAADSIALAASQELPDEAAAYAKADEWAAKNGIDPARMTVVVMGGSIEPKVVVRIDRPYELHFLKAVGIESRNVTARAAAIKASFGGGAAVVPWSIEQPTLEDATNGSSFVIKYDANNGANGNFNAVRLDGSGASDYEESATFGSDSQLCAVSTANCTVAACSGSSSDGCAETAPQCTGPECRPKTGNMTGPTRDAVDYRISHTSPQCDTFAETFPTQKADGTYQISPSCNPWNGPGVCTSPTDLCSRRVLVIPVVDDFGNGSSDPVEIQRFALVYLEGYANGSCTGNSCEINARFVRAELGVNALAGIYEPEAPIQFVRLVE
ncbi:MAG: Tad domain-containing protein [Dehalococcoidia bacterium]